VLLVEDESFVREATKYILQSAGFEVLEAGDAQDALRIWQENNYRLDLLMSDLGLPGRDGRHLAREMRQHSPEIPILLTSGYLLVDYEQESAKDRTYYLPKPYSRSDLVAKLAQIFNLPQRKAALAG